jgi:hypothetical protein
VATGKAGWSKPTITVVSIGFGIIYNFNRISADYTVEYELYDVTFRIYTCRKSCFDTYNFYVAEKKEDLGKIEWVTEIRYVDLPSNVKIDPDSLIGILGLLT